MAAIRGNASWQRVIVVVCTAGVVAAWLRFGLLPTVHAQQTYTPLDDATQSSVNALRTVAGLDNDALAALNLTENRLVNLLAAVRTWHELNLATLRQRRSALADARAIVRVEQSAVDAGQDRAQQLAEARSQLAFAQSSFNQLVADFREHATDGFSPAESALLARLAVNRTTPMPYRVLELSAQAAGALQHALFTYAQQIAAARGDNDRTKALQSFQSELESAIGAENVATISGLGSYLPASSARVTAAVAEVFPAQAPE